jgi:hypothetical protein
MEKNRYRSMEHQTPPTNATRVVNKIVGVNVKTLKKEKSRVLDVLYIIWCKPAPTSLILRESTAVASN